MKASSMKKVILLLFMSLSTCLSAQIATHNEGQRTSRQVVSLLEALQAISSRQSEYSIDILSDGLDSLTTSAKVTMTSSVPDVVKRLFCDHELLYQPTYGHMSSLN